MSLLRSLFSFRGRTGRAFYWLFYLIHAAAYGAAAVVFYFATERHVQQGSPYGSYAILAFLLGTAVVFIPAAAVATRRLHDRGRSGRWLVLGGALAFLAVATVLKYAPSFNYLTLHTNNFIKTATAVASTAMVGYVPWSASVLIDSRGDAEYSYLLPALLGVGPVLIFGIWFLIDVGLMRGISGANAYGPAPTRWLGSDGAISSEARPRSWLPISGATLAAIAGIVLLSGVLESHTMPCDLAQEITPSTPSSAREFEDCFDVKGKRACGPRMVVIPAGSFQMGSTNSMAMPIHTVTFAKPFALGKFEVTAAQWEACIVDGGCKGTISDGWQQRSRDITGSRCRKPVGPSWRAITTEYLPWLARVTGKSYRLPSESEWEYAARAGRTTEFPEGYHLSPEYENYDDSQGSNCLEKTIKGRWIDAGSLKPNPFGLHDMLGNSDEWVADIFNFNRYELAPTDGSAWMQPMQQSIVGDMRVVRGGGWCTKADALSPALRKSNFPVEGSAGFRIALSMPTAAEAAVAASNDKTSCTWPYPSTDRINACTRVIDRAKERGLSESELAVHYADRANALRASGRLDEAIADNTLALKLSGNTFYNSSIGAILLQKKEYQKALDAFDASRPSENQMLGRAQALEGLGRNGEAVNVYEAYEKEFGVAGYMGDGPRKTANEALIRLGARKPPEPASTSPAPPEAPCAVEQREMDELNAKAAATGGGDQVAACALISPMATASYKYCSCSHGAPQSRLESCLGETGKPIRELKKKFGCP